MSVAARGLGGWGATFLGMSDDERSKRSIAEVRAVPLWQQPIKV